MPVLSGHRWGKFNQRIRCELSSDTSLLSGLYTFLVLIPALAMSDGYNAWALVGWSASFLPLGLALYQQHVAPSADTAVAAA